MDTPFAVAAAEHGTTIRIFRTLDELESIHPLWVNWKTHRDSDISFCSEFVWQRAEFIRPHVIVIYKDGHPDAVLVGRVDTSKIELKIGFLKLATISLKTLSFAYGGVLGNASPQNCATFIRSIVDSLRAGEGRCAFLHCVAVDSSLYESARALPVFGCRDQIIRPEAHSTMKLAETSDKAFEGLSSGLRADLRRKSRKLLKDFPEQVVIRSIRSASELNEALDSIEEIAKKSYQRNLGVGFCNTPEMRKRLLFLANRGWLRVYLMTLKDVPCAFWIGTLYNGSFCSDYLSFDPQFGEYSPGMYLLTKMIEEFCKEGVEEIDFGPGNSRYKERFANSQVMESSIYIFPASIVGLTVNAGRTLTGSADKLARKILEKTTFMTRLKRSWRARLVKGAGPEEKQSEALK